MSHVRLPRAAALLSQVMIGAVELRVDRKAVARAFQAPVPVNAGVKVQDGVVVVDPVNVPTKFIVIVPAAVPAAVTVVRSVPFSFVLPATGTHVAVAPVTVGQVGTSPVMLT